METKAGADEGGWSLYQPVGPGRSSRPFCRPAGANAVTVRVVALLLGWGLIYDRSYKYRADTAWLALGMGDGVRRINDSAVYGVWGVSVVVCCGIDGQGLASWWA
jgi:hypothetical protein